MPPTVKALRYAPALALVALAISAGPAAAECTPTTRVCVAASSEPSAASVPSQTSGTAAYLRYTVTVANNGPSTINHTSLTSRLSDSSPTNVATPAAFLSTPGCNASGYTTACPVGSLASGETAQFTQVVRAPALIDPTQVDHFANTFTIMFDERTNDNPSNGGKTDTVSTSPVVDVSGNAGTTFVPPSSLGVESVALTTSPTGSAAPSSSDTKIARVSIPTTASGFVASLTEPATGTPIDCTQFTGSDGHTHICRGSGWFQAAVAGYPFTGKVLTFDLYWDATVISPLQTLGNFEVFHATTAAVPPQQWEILSQSQKCKSASDAGPCFDGKPDVDANGDWHAKIRRPSNGYMR
jgi:hypothetical protein